MSDENEGPPPLSPQLHEFFEAHAKTGEPTQAELGRALLRLHGATRPTMLSVAGRRLLPPELLAVAAVLVLSVGGAFIGWRVRSANAQTAALLSAKAAWVRGDLEAASAAFEACSTAECARLAAAVKRAKVQSENLAGLDEAEAGSLLALDRELSEGQRSVLAERLERKPEPPEDDQAFATRQIAALTMAGHERTSVNAAAEAFVRGSAERASPVRARLAFSLVITLVPGTDLARAAAKKLEALPPEPVPGVAPTAPPEVASLLERAKVAKKEQRYDEAVSVLEQCLRDAPDQPDCVVSLASTFATRGSQTNNQDDNMRAQTLYLRFLEVADPMDKRINRVREIVGERSASRVKESDFMLQPSTRANEDAAEDAYQRGYMLRERDPAAAARLFTEALALSDPGSSTAAKARAQLERLQGKDAVVPAWAKDRAHDLYLKGYQLRETEPAEARRLFHQVIEVAPGSTDAQKAQARLDAMNEEEASAVIKTAPASRQAITLRVGERVSLTVTELERLAIGDESTADIISEGSNEFQLVGVGAGTTTLVAWHNGKRTTWRVTVTGGLGRIGHLKIASNPTNALVFVDGKSTGRRTPVLPLESFEVPVGRHTIQFEWNGKRSAVQTIDVVEGINPVIKGDIPQ